MEFKRRIVLEDTGERRYPNRNEFYVYLPEPTRVHTGFCGEYRGKGEDFAILRVVENEFTEGEYLTAVKTEDGLQCPHCKGSVRYAESGFIASHGGVCFDASTNTFFATGAGIGNFTDEGDRMYLECGECLKKLNEPEGFEFEWR